MRFFFKFVASTVGVACTAASAYFFVDDKKRYSVLFAANVAQSPTDNNSDPIRSGPSSFSSPIRSSEQWNWNWDGLVQIMIKTFLLPLLCSLYFIVTILK